MDGDQDSPGYKQGLEGERADASINPRKNLRHRAEPYLTLALVRIVNLEKELERHGVD
jgi:hypothetical protein